MAALDTGAGPQAPAPSERDLARKRLEARQDFRSHFVVYVVFNLFLIGIWAFTGGGYFWPAWILGGWGAAVMMHAWDVYFRHAVTEADVDAELRRLHR